MFSKGLIKLTAEQAQLFIKVETLFADCMTKMLEKFEPQNLNNMNSISKDGVKTDRKPGSLLPFIYKVEKIPADFNIYMSERFFKSLPVRLSSSKDQFTILTGVTRFLDDGFIAEGDIPGWKVMCLSDSFSGKVVSIMNFQKFIGKSFCIQNAQEIMDLLCWHKKKDFDTRSANLVLEKDFQVI
jgi:hypothetical protein